ncbi:MAG: hypothetical protein K2M10_06070, partial [Muribaculaceae bacterium]|nr:hypothetical protein [Muribaculaceae bacterium]
MAIKPLVIDARTGAIGEGARDEWNLLANATTFIKEIQTPELTEDANFASLISGIPTAFARVDLFKTAFEVSDDNAAASRNLVAYYADLTSEWRGFVAAIALDYANFKAYKIDLKYSDGKPITETANIYEPAGAFGNMLLDRKDRWSLQDLPDNEEKVPYINLIKYHGNVVGATSPESILFTSSAYRLPDNQQPWIKKGKNARVPDPLKSEMTQAQVLALSAYVDHLTKQLNELQGYFKADAKVNFGGIRRNLEEWQTEIADYAAKRNFSLKGGTIPAVNLDFYGPFGKLFNHEDRVYGTGGQVSSKKTDENDEGYNPRESLLPDTARIARINLPSEFNKNPEKLRELPMYLLKAEKKGYPGEYAFFALPLSVEGLNRFGKSIGAILGLGNDGSEQQSSLTAVFDPEVEENNLTVTLTIEDREGNKRTYLQTYTVGNYDKMRNKDILLWPNFVSERWTKYYLYSELPHNNMDQSY